VGGFFYNLGRAAGPTIRRGKWIWQSLTGSEEEAAKLEYEVGKDLANEIRRRATFDEDPQIARMLNETGTRLAGCLTNKRYKFSFQSLAGGAPNAFALPGGFIFVNRPLIELCERNADETAFILGHEMGHVVRGHAIKRIITNSAVVAATSAAAWRGFAGAWLQKVGLQFLQSAYSREQELEADELAARLIIAAGYNRDAPEVLLARLAGLRRDNIELDLGKYFSSHPAFDERVENIQRILRS
jgi:predicted Zn-dependent protease